MEAIQFLDGVGGRKALYMVNARSSAFNAEAPLIKLFLHHLFIKISGHKNECVERRGGMDLERQSRLLIELYLVEKTSQIF